MLRLLRLLPFLLAATASSLLRTEPCASSSTSTCELWPTPTTPNRSAFLGRARQSLDRMEAASRDRGSGHRPAVAAASLPRVLDQALRPAYPRSPARQRRDQSPGQPNGRGESTLGRPAYPCRAPQARHRPGRAHRLPADAETSSPAVTDLADIPHQPCPRSRFPRFLH